jgi:hypothetical protein
MYCAFLGIVNLLTIAAEDKMPQPESGQRTFCAMTVYTETKGAQIGYEVNLLLFQHDTRQPERGNH